MLGDMTTRQNLNSAADSKGTGGHDTQVYNSLFQGYKETILPGHRAMCKLFSKNESFLLLKLINVISY